MFAARKEQGRTETIIAGIFGGANAAVAAERRHAHGSAGAENGEFYGSSRHLLDEIVSRDGGVGIILPEEFARLSRGFDRWLLGWAYCAKAAARLRQAGKTAALQGRQDGGVYGRDLAFAGVAAWAATAWLISR